MNWDVVLQVGSWVASALLTVALFVLRILHKEILAVRDRVNEVDQQYVTEEQVRQIVRESEGYREDAKVIERRLDQHDKEISTMRTHLETIRDGQQQIQGSLSELRQELRAWHGHQ